MGNVGELKMENKQIVLTMTAAQVNIILAHLSNGVFKEVHDLINLITVQGNQQIAAAQKPTEEAQDHGTFVLSNDEKPATPPAPSEPEQKPEVMN